MAKQKKPYNSGERPEGEDSEGEGPEEGEGREREVHEEIIKRLLEGGAPPTPEAFARGLKQWQQLPGSIIRSSTDVNLPFEESSQDFEEASSPPPLPQNEGDKERQP